MHKALAKLEPLFQKPSCNHGHALSFYSTNYLVIIVKHKAFAKLELFSNEYLVIIVKHRALAKHELLLNHPSINHNHS
jgi:hypothetical protein